MGVITKTTNTPLSFLRGTDKNLKDMKSYTDGTFYLTTDTHRLYTCINSDLIELNQSITVVENIDSLPTTGIANGQFYFVTNPNVLVYYDEEGGEQGTGAFIQINPDTKTILGTASTPISHSDSGLNVPATTTVTPTLPYIFHGTNGVKTGTESGNKTFPIRFYDGANINITKKTYDQQDGIEIRSNDYKIVDSFNSGEGTYTANLQTSSDGSTYAPINQNRQDISLKQGANIYFSQESADSPLLIKAADSKVSQANLSINDDGKLTIDITSTREQNDATGSGHGSASSTLTPIIRYGIATTETTEPEEGDPVTTTTYSGNAGFSPASTNGTTYVNLDVYTQQEVDDLISNNLQGYNALQYKGSITDQQDFIDIERAGVSNGDVYYIVPNATSGFINYQDKIYRTNDLVIYTGTEDENGYITSIQNDNRILVPSGNDTVDISYIVTNRVSGAEKIGTYALQQNGANLKAIQHRGSTNIQVTLTQESTGELKGANNSNLNTIVTTTQLVWGSFEAES